VTALSLAICFSTKVSWPFSRPRATASRTLALRLTFSVSHWSLPSRLKLRSMEMSGMPAAPGPSLGQSLTLEPRPLSARTVGLFENYGLVGDARRPRESDHHGLSDLPTLELLGAILRSHRLPCRYRAAAVHFNGELDHRNRLMSGIRKHSIIMRKHSIDGMGYSNRNR